MFSSSVTAWEECGDFESSFVHLEVFEQLRVLITVPPSLAARGPLRYKRRGTRDFAETVPVRA